VHPNKKQYTYRTVKDEKTIMSRLDRIYSSRQHAQKIFEWKSGPTTVPTDHCLVSLKFAPKDAPLIRNGRWTWFIPSLDEKPLIDEIVTHEKTIQMKFENLQAGLTTRDETNPQALWEIFKADLKKTTKKKADKSHHKASSRIKRLERDCDETRDDPNFEYDEDARAKESYLMSEIKHIITAKDKENREDLRATIADHSEKLGGIWSAINKEKKPRDLIRRLRTPGSNPPQYERSTVRMAELARSYHQNLQNDTDPPPSDEERREQIERQLEEIPAEQTIENPGETSMNVLISENSIRSALSQTKNRTATGIDGCP
jgi:hypothetical protein